MMKNNRYDDIDITEYRQRFHKFAYLRQKEKEAATRHTIESIFDKNLGDPRQAVQNTPSIKPEPPHISKSIDELICELLDLELPKKEELPPPTTNYKIPTDTFQEAHEAVPDFAVSPPSKEVVSQLAKAFITNFSPWLQRYKLKTNRGWITRSKRLHFSSICKAIQGELTLAFFSTINTKVLGIDIDDHRTYYSSSEVLQSCKETYRKVQGKIGYSPSLIVQSSRGLHLFYLLSEPIYWEHLHHLTKELIQGANVELLPTTKSSLRIPRITSLLHPTTLEPLEQYEPEYTDWNYLQTYSPSQLFGKNWKEQIYRSTHTQDSRSREKSNSSKPMNLKLLEQTLLPFRNGHTYKPVFELTVACKRLGMSRGEIIIYLQDLIEQSHGYTGGLKKNRKELEDRVDHILGKGHTSASLPSIDTKTDILSKYDPAIKHLRFHHPFSPQRNKPVQSFIERLILWKEWHDRIFTGPEATSLLDSLYPFYRKNRREGFYPLPSSLLKRWHPKYYELIHWLEDVEVLQESPYPYSKSAHICKYYAISFEHLKT